MRVEGGQAWSESLPVVGILRGFDRQAIEGVVPAAIRGGLRHLEITLNTPGALDLIRSAVDLAEGRLSIGAGTVLTGSALEGALSAGAGFIVTPVVSEAVIQRCVDLKVPNFPGALTPTEIVRAWDMGATMVKVFPADWLGPAYLKSLKAPLPHLKLMPTGGVNLETLKDYGGVADGFGVGSPLFPAERVMARDWGWIERQCRAFCDAAAALRRSESLSF
jgi:2-dehydro-3-deoxyphosphogluconate aldolase/(4S)-4-hydroxy-2-oxoglutarate aldolase